MVERCGYFVGFARMIVRVSSEFVISNRIAEFLAILRTEILPAYASAEGILSVLVLNRALIGYNEVMILSLWKTKEAAIESASCGFTPAESLKDLGVIQKETITFELVSSWSSEQSRQNPASTNP